MAAAQPARIQWRVAALLLLFGAAGGAVGFARWAQGRAAARLRARAQEGFIVEAWTQRPSLFKTELRDVKLRFRASPAMVIGFDRADLMGGLSGSPQLAIDRVELQVSEDPARVYRAWESFPVWKGLPITWQRLHLVYERRELGRVLLDDARLERAGDKWLVRARAGRLWGLTFADLVFWVGKRNQLIEIGLGALPGQPLPAQLGYFASSGVAAQWLFSARHQPVRPIARALGWELGETFESSRAVTSASWIVPDDPTRPKRVSVELAIDAWPRPAWPDASALLGETLAFAAFFPFPAQPSVSFAVPRVSLSLLLFTLTGTGSMRWGSNPKFSFDVTGKLTCAQLRGNLSPSIHLDRVRAYLEPEHKLAPPDAEARLNEAVELRLKVDAEQRDPTRRRAAWHLSAGCGLPPLSDG